MNCEVCNKDKGDLYIAFPNVPHMTEDILVFSICGGCITDWFKLISKEHTREFKHWTLRSCVFVHKMELQPSGKWKTTGYTPKEEDLSI